MQTAIPAGGYAEEKPRSPAVKETVHSLETKGGNGLRHAAITEKKGHPKTRKAVVGSEKGGGEAALKTKAKEGNCALRRGYEGPNLAILGTNECTSKGRRIRSREGRRPP